MLVLLPLAVWAIRTESRKVLRLAAAGCAGLILCGQLLSFSRGAVVALVVLMVAMVVSGFIRLRHFVAVALAFVALIAVVAPDLILRVQSIEKAGTATSQTDTQADNATRGRVTIQLAALHVIRDHPLIGVGPGEFFNTYSKQYANALDLDFQQSRRRAHNLYLEIAADTGIVGLAAFLSILAVTMVQLRRLSRFWRRRQPVYAELAQALFLSLVAYMASAVFLQLSYQRYFWFLIGISNATIWILSRAARQSVPPQRGGQP
jgi:O-antigen ligase